VEFLPSPPREGSQPPTRRRQHRMPPPRMVVQRRCQDVRAARFVFLHVLRAPPLATQLALARSPATIACRVHFLSASRHAFRQAPRPFTGKKTEPGDGWRMAVAAAGTPSASSARTEEATRAASAPAATKAAPTR